MTTPRRREGWQVARAETARRLRLQLGLCCAVFTVVTVLVVIRVGSDGFDVFWPLVGVALGLLLGVILGRSKPLRWDAAAHQVVSTMSLVGLTVTVAYLALRLVGERLLGRRVDDVELASVVGLAVTGGVMLGRTLVMLRSIRRVLASAGRLDAGSSAAK